MKTLYIQCEMGAAGDMLMGALWEVAGKDPEITRRLNAMAVPGLAIVTEEGETCGIHGTHMRVTIEGAEETEHEEHHQHHHHHHHHHHHEDHEEHHHYGVRDIEEIIEGLELGEKVKKDAKEIYAIIADAESRVHGTEMQYVHFHEVGSLDAVADVAGCCMLMDVIGADRVVVSPVNTGSGTVRCAHGVLPVPAPATELILRGIPCYSGNVESELCTPTGAALLKYFADDFGPMPVMKVERTGYGIGTRKFPDHANCIRVFLGEETGGCERGNGWDEEIYELSANIDDMSGEDLGFAMEALMKGKALDVYAEHITMKKSRPAVKLCCLCRKEDREGLVKIFFKNTSSIGIREQKMGRYALKRELRTGEIEGVKVETKLSSGYGVERVKAGFDGARELSLKKGIPLEEARREIIHSLGDEKK